MSDRAVLVVPVMPAAGGNGLAMRAGLLLEGLSGTFAVDLVVIPVFGAPAPVSEFVSGLARSVHVLESRAEHPAADMARRLSTQAGRERAQALHPLPVLSGAATPEAAESVAELAVGTALVVVMRTYLAPVLDALLDARPRPKLWLDVDDLESDTQRALGRLDEADRLVRVEAHYLPLIDRVIACSAQDAATLAGRHELHDVSVVPNAVRVPPTPPPTPSAGHDDLLLVGTLSYEPNAEAAQWLVRQVLPLLGEARIAIVGSRPPLDVQALADGDRITVAADVEDVSPWYARSRVAVVPMLRGGGTHIKLLEALAHGLPVVATSTGARGLPWPRSPGPVVLGDTPAEFAAACRTLLSDPDRSAELGRRGRELVARHASVEAVSQMLVR
jgi:glycosyltransferase involved in cell wall biosynthesis